MEYIKLEERIRQAAEALDKHHGEHIDIVFNNDFPGSVELVAYLNEVRPHVILHILDKLDKVQVLIDEIEKVMWINDCRCEPYWKDYKRHSPNSICGEMDGLKEALADFRGEK